MISTALHVFTALAVMALLEVCWKTDSFPFLMDHWKRSK